jgi:hypothetical protein
MDNGRFTYFVFVQDGISASFHGTALLDNNIQVEGYILISV